jgi:hypothetical protein
MRVLRRTIAVAIGFAAACLAASLFAHVVFFIGAGVDSLTRLDEIIGPLWVSIPTAIVFSALLGFAPAGLAIALAEMRSIRSWVHFVGAGAGGGLIALVAAAGVAGTFGAITRAIAGEGLPPGFDPMMTSAIVAAGALSGGVYWLVAGRGSGNWRGPAMPAPSGS